MGEPHIASCFHANAPMAGRTLVSALRDWLPNQSWSKLRRLIHSRRVTVNHAMCLDEERRLVAGDVVRVLNQSLPRSGADEIQIRHVDERLVVADKPPRMMTLRHRAERHWSQTRKTRQPALDELLPAMLLQHEGPHAARRRRRPRLYAVHRIDRDTSGLLVFARDPLTQQQLIQQFASRQAGRTYLAIVLGHVAAQTITSSLVRDRGDGLRGSEPLQRKGRHAVTHVQPLQTLANYTLLECRLETGRTHQIRIHLAELGHPVCGDPLYRGPLGGPAIADHSGAPRLALHATCLRLTHPVSGQQIECRSPLPDDLRCFWERLVNHVAGSDSAQPGPHCDNRVPDHPKNLPGP